MFATPKEAIGKEILQIGFVSQKQRIFLLK